VNAGTLSIIFFGVNYICKQFYDGVDMTAFLG